MSRVRLLLVLLVALAGNFATAGVVHASAHAYDESAPARAEFAVLPSTSVALTHLGAPSAGRVEGWTAVPRSFTTPTTLGNATNNVSSILDSLQKGKQSGVRTVDSDAALQALFDLLSAGGTPIPRPSYDGHWVRLDDGCEVGLRNSSTSGGRTIDVRSADGTTRWKVHIA